jgi:hypothetical protein
VCLQPRPEPARLARPAQVKNDLTQTMQGTLFACLDHFSPAEVKMVFATKLAVRLRGQPPQLPNPDCVWELVVVGLAHREIREVDNFIETCTTFRRIITMWNKLHN